MNARKMKLQGYMMHRSLPLVALTGLGTGAALNKSILRVPRYDDIILTKTDIAFTPHATPENGNFFTQDFVTTEADGFTLLGIGLSVVVSPASADSLVSPTATLAVAIGTGAATQATLSGTQVNVLASTALALTDGAGSASVFTGVLRNVPAAETWKINIGLPFADILEDVEEPIVTDVTASFVATLRLFYLQTSGETVE